MGRGQRYNAKAKRLINKDVYAAADIDADHLCNTDLKKKLALELGEALLAAEDDEDLALILHGASFPRAVTISPSGASHRGTIFGAPTAQYQPAAGVSLHKLPAEIRKTIYSLVLTKPGPIEISVYRDRLVTGPYFRDEKVHRFRDWDKEKGKWIDNPPSFASILSTSKEMYSETAPVLYGSNHFILPRQHTTKLFIKTLKPARMFLTVVVFKNTKNLAQVYLNP